MDENKSNVANKAKQLSVQLCVSKPDIQYKWRFESMIVAWLDIVISAIFLAVLGPASIGMTYLAVGTDRLKWNETFHEMYPVLTAKNWKFNLGITIALFYIGSVSCVISIWTGNVLRIATNLSIKDPIRAEKKAMIWMQVSLIMFGLSLFSVVVYYSFWTFWICVLINIVQIVVVRMHIKELRSNLGWNMPRENYDSEKQEVTMKTTKN